MYNIVKEDRYSDIEILEAQYKIGSSIFFEVENTVAPNQGKNQTIKESGILLTAVGLEAKPIVSGSTGLVISSGFGGGSNEGYNEIRSGQGHYNGSSGFGCPFENDFVLVGEKGDKFPRPVFAKALLSENYSLYNPLTRNYNKIKDVKLIKDVEMYGAFLDNFPLARVSKTHKCILNTNDLNGTFLSKYKKNSEILSILVDVKNQEISLKTNSIELFDYNPTETFNAIEISLEEEFIYCSGVTKTHFLLGHNRKDDREFYDV